MFATLHRDPTLDLRSVLDESFRLDEVSGFYMPQEPGLPLVRVYVAGSSYMVERRRNSRSAWMPIVTADVAEFDAAAFRSWRATYPMVEPVA